MMSSCLYSLVGVALTAAIIPLGFLLLGRLVEAVKRWDFGWVAIVGPVAAAFLFAILYFDFLPKKLNIVDCRTGKRTTSLAFNCSISGKS